MKKIYEKPEVVVMEFELTEAIMEGSNTGTGMSSIEEGVDPDFPF